MYEKKLSQTIARVEQALAENGYSANGIQHFSNTTNQLLKFMDSYRICEYSMDVGVRFMSEQYGFHAEDGLSKNNRSRMQDLTILSEVQLHGTFVLRHRNRKYRIPPAFRTAANEFLARRRFCGIVEQNMGTLSCIWNDSSPICRVRALNVLSRLRANICGTICVSSAGSAI